MITIESHDNLIIKSDFKRTQQRSFATRLYSPNFVVSYSAWTYPQLEIDESLSGIHNTFRAKTDTHLTYVMFIVIIILSITTSYIPWVMQVLILGMKTTHFLIEYPCNNYTFSASGPLLKAFSVDVILSGYHIGDNSLLSLLFTGKECHFL